MKDKFRKFYEMVGKKYPEDKLIYSSISGILRKKWIQHKLNDFPSGNLLDCGCNTGRLSADWEKGMIIGIDISHEVLKKGKTLFSHINFIQADLRELDFLKPGAIDNAIVCEVLEHLDQPIVFLRGLFQALRLNGMLLITVPNYTRTRVTLIPLGIMRSFGITTGTHGRLMLHHTYKPDELAGLVKNAGFSILEKGSFEIELRLWQKPLTYLERIYTMLSEKYFPASKLNILFYRMLEHIKVFLYNIMELCSIPVLIKKIFREGRRSYVVATKIKSNDETI